MSKKKEEPKTKVDLAKEREQLIELLRSGYAALDSVGKIVDRREVSKVAKAFAEEPLLGIPEPVK